MKKSVLLSFGFVILVACADTPLYSYIGIDSGTTDDPFVPTNWQGGETPPSGASLVFDTVPQAYGVRCFYRPRQNESDTLYFGSISGTGSWYLQFGVQGVFASIATAADFNGFISTAGTPLTIDPPEGVIGKINHFNPAPRCNSTGKAWIEPGVNVPEGKEAIVGKIYEDNIWRKKGEGKLTVEESNGSFGRIMLEGGTLAIKETVKVPVITSLPGCPFMHFDASARDTIKLDASGRVEKWNDVSGNGVYASKYKTAACPTVKENFANGLPVLDFGAYSLSSEGYIGEELKDDKSNESAALAPSDITKKTREIFVVSADRGKYSPTSSWWGGPFIIGNAAFDFHRGNYGAFIINGGKPSSRYGRFTLNGKNILPYHNTFSTHLQVISMSFDNPYSVQYFANDREAYRRGGIYLAEYISYSNALTEVERKQVIDYLKNKWLSADEIANDDVELSELDVKSGIVEVGEGETVKVKSLRVDQGTSLVKTGEGTLEVKSVYPSSDLSVDVRGGVVSFSKDENVSSEDPQIAPDALLHFDASDESTFTILERDGKFYVSRWKDVRPTSPHECYAENDNQMPWLERNSVNGKSVVNFGMYSKDMNATDSGWLWLPSNVSKKTSNNSPYWLKEGFYVYKDNAAETEPFILGDWAGGDNGAFQLCRGSKGRLLSEHHAAWWVRNGVWSVNGMPVYPMTFIPSNDEFNVVSFTSTEPLRNVSTLVRDRSVSLGGVQIAEIILYTRTLTEKERRDTQAYLLKKWKNQNHPDRVENISFSEVKLSGESSAIKVNGMSAQIGRFESDGAIRVVGDGEVTVNSIFGSNGVSADGSSLSYVEAFPSPTFHVDASVEGSLEVETINGTNFVSRWNDVRGEGYPYAYHRIDEAANVIDGVKPYVVGNVTNSLPAVDFGPFFSYPQSEQNSPFAERMNIALEGGGSGLEWSKDIKVKEYFLVWGDHGDDKKSAFALGSSYSHPTHRGDRGMMFAGHADDNLEKFSRININGEESSATTVLPNGLNVVAVSITNGTSVLINTFVRDRSNCRLGGTVLGEVLVYDYSLTDYQRDVVVRYLSEKWHAKIISSMNAYDSMTVANDGVVSFAESDIDAKNVTGDGTIDVRTLIVSERLASAGTLNLQVVDGANVKVKDDVTIGVVIDSEGVPSKVNVAGGIELEGSGVVDISLAEDGKVVYGDYPILVASEELNIPEGISSWAVSSELSSKHSFSLYVEGDTMYLRILSPGTCIIFK